MAPSGAASVGAPGPAAASRAEVTAGTGARAPPTVPRGTARGAAAAPLLRCHQRSLGMDISSSDRTAASVMTAKTSSAVRSTDSQTIVPEKSAAHKYMISTLRRCEWPMSSRR